MRLPKDNRQRMLRLFLCAAALIIALAACHMPNQKPADQQGFASPQQAVAALVGAVQNDDDSALLAILGPDAAGSDRFRRSGGGPEQPSALFRSFWREAPS